MKPIPNAADVVNKWERNILNAEQTIKDGVNRMTADPAKNAIAQGQRYVDGVKRAYDEKKWERGLARITPQMWKDAMLTKGVPHIADGVKQGKVKYTRFWNEYSKYLAGLEQILEKNPRGTRAQNRTRLNAVLDYLEKFKMP